MAEVRYLVCGLPGTALPDRDLVDANLDSVDHMVADSLDTCTLFSDQTGCRRDQRKSPFEGAGRGVPATVCFEGQGSMVLGTGQMPARTAWWLTAWTPALLQQPDRLPTWPAE